MATQQDKKNKLPIWARLIIYMTLLFLVGLVITKFWLNPPLFTIFPPIFGLLGAFFDKDVRQMIFQWFLSNFSNKTTSSTNTSSSVQSPINITFSPIMSQNVSSQPPFPETSTHNKDTTPLDNPSTGQQDGKVRDPDSIFLFNMRLPDADNFFGRVPERGTLINRTRNGASTSIVGVRRIGKSWLIEYLRLVAKDQLGSCFRIGYLDATQASCATVAGFTTRALEELDILSSHADNAHIGLAMLERVVRDLNEVKFQFFVLMSLRDLRTDKYLTWIFSPHCEL